MWSILSSAAAEAAVLTIHIRRITTILTAEAAHFTAAEAASARSSHCSRFLSPVCNRVWTPVECVACAGYKSVRAYPAVAKCSVNSEAYDFVAGSIFKWISSRTEGYGT